MVQWVDRLFPALLRHRRKQTSSRRLWPQTFRSSAAALELTSAVWCLCDFLAGPVFNWPGCPLCCTNGQASKRLETQALLCSPPTGLRLKPRAGIRGTRVFTQPEERRKTPRAVFILSRINTLDWATVQQRSQLESPVASKEEMATFLCGAANSRVSLCVCVCLCVSVFVWTTGDN